MKITGVDVIPIGLSANSILQGEVKASEHVIVRVHTDESLVGIGESSPVRRSESSNQLESSAQAIVVLLNQLKPVLVGSDPFQIGPLFEKMDKVVRGCLWAKAGINIALFDLIGKACKKPISALLGGSFREKLPVEFPLTERMWDPTMIGEKAEEAVRLGYKFLEVKAGTDPDLDVEKVRAIREAVGNKVSLKVDLNTLYKNADIAIMAIKRMEKFDVDFVEQPLSNSDVRGMTKITEAVDVKIVADEMAGTLPMLVENIIRKKAADAVHLKICKGGISDTLKMVTVAEAAGIIPIVGAAYSFGVGISAVHQVASALTTLYRPDHYGQPFYIDDILTVPLAESEGYVQVSQKPGLGVDLDERKLETYRIK